MRKLLVLICMTVYITAPILASDPALVKLSVKGMHCSGCENKVKQVLNDINGVTTTESVSADAGSAVITIDKSVTTEEKVATQLAAKTGYDVGIIHNGITSKSSTTTCPKSSNKSKCCTSGQTSPACTPKK